MANNRNILVDYPIFLETGASGLDTLKRMDRANATDYLHNFPYDYTHYPWLYFIYDGDFLKCLGTNDSIPCHGEYFDPRRIQSIEKIYPQLFSPDPASPNATPIYQEIGIALKGLIFTDYYNALMNFKWKTGLRSFPLFDLQNNIRVIDGRLWGCVSEKGQLCWKLLTNKVVAQEVKKFGGHEYGKENLKKKLAKELLELHPEQNAQDENPGLIDVTTPDFHLSYSLLLNQAEVTRLNGFRFHITSPSPSLRDFLRIIAEESKNRLDDFAELLARLYRPELPSEYLWGIVGKRNDISWFLQLLWDNLRLYGIASGIFEKPSDKSLTQVLECQANHIAYQINDSLGNSELFKEVNHSHIMRFIAGDVIGTLDDPYIVKDEVVGRGVLMYAASELSEDCMGKLPHKIIRLPDDCPSFQIQADDIIWMQTCLLCHGFNLLTTSELGFSSETLSLDQALKKFVTGFCEPRPGTWTDRKQFYEQFKRYCDVCVTVGEKIPGPTKFASYVESELCWTSKTVRSNNNRLAFDGIFMDEERIEHTIQEASKEKNIQNGQSSFDFDAYIDSFSKYLHLPGSTQGV